ncbi:MAG: 2-oxoacid:ferredoxin oxidoreductase subunit beta [Candidatus Eisenbacteria bacterium]|nr:2-oxoacid:ferredoxin oxidoreductase subunit beta [Candidatus Eisenbacteria bacterium]
MPSQEGPRAPRPQASPGSGPEAPRASNPHREALAEAGTEAPAARKGRDYRGRLKPIWCPGCGNFGILSAMLNAFADLEIDPDNLAVVSGIGCSSRLPGFVRAYGFHGVHGRALPTAVGVKLGNPRLTVMVVGGDGDGLSIGAGHFPHVARRNVDITYLMLDNRTYGLTKGQTSPTTPHGFLTKTSPAGVIETPLNPVAFAISFGAGYVARAYTVNTRAVRQVIADAIRHPGFAMVHLLTPCVTFGRGSGYDFFNERIQPLPEDHDPTDFCKAIFQSDQPEAIYTGLFYHVPRPEYVASLQEKGAAHGRELEEQAAPRIDTDSLIARFS